MQEIGHNIRMKIAHFIDKQAHKHKETSTEETISHIILVKEMQQYT